MAKALSIGDRVKWTIRDHGKDKILRGWIISFMGSVVRVDLGEKTVTTKLAGLSRCHGRKPAKPATEAAPF
jgi:hypothetical protein